MTVPAVLGERTSGEAPMEWDQASSTRSGCRPPRPGMVRRHLQVLLVLFRTVVATGE